MDEYEARRRRRGYSRTRMKECRLLQPEQRHPSRSRSDRQSWMLLDITSNSAAVATPPSSWLNSTRWGIPFPDFTNQCNDEVRSSRSRMTRNHVVRCSARPPICTKATNDHEQPRRRRCTKDVSTHIQTVASSTTVLTNSTEAHIEEHHGYVMKVR